MKPSRDPASTSSKRIVALALVLVAALASTAHAAEPKLVKDIERSSTGCTTSEFVAGPGGLYFGTAFTCRGGLALWRTDGSAAGTRVVKSFARGANDLGGVYPLLTIDGVLYFGLTAYDSIGAPMVELWRSDGSEQGTVMVRAFPPSWSVAYEPTLLPMSVAEFGGKLVFFVSKGFSRESLWVSDGTPAGTHKLREMRPGSHLPVPFVRRHDGLLFVTRGFAGFDLWRTDGTRAGTGLVHQFGSQGDDPVEIALADDDAIYFTVTLAPNVRELWRSDGSAQTTGRVLTLPLASRWVLVDGIHFALESRRGALRVWRLDPSSGALTLLHDFSAPPLGENELLVKAQRDGVLYFTARLGFNGPPRLWRSDGSVAGTFELHAGPLYGDLRPAAHGFVFEPEPPDGADVLWYTDGSVAGTVEVISASAEIFYFDHAVAALPDTTLVAAVDFDRYQAGGSNLMRSDGTAAGTSLLRSVTGVPATFGVRGGVASFVANATLWRSDGTPEGTSPLVELGSETLGSSPQSLTDVGGTLFFDVRGALGTANELWRSDGTRPGTTLVADFPDGDTNLRLLTRAGDRLFFARGTSELWTSDGTAAGGTQLLAETSASGPDAEIREVHDVAGATFAAIRGVEPTVGALWRSDGTVVGTEPIASVAPSNLTTFAGALFFSAPTSSATNALWRSDGSASGTAPLVRFSAVNAARLPLLGTIFPRDGAFFFSVGRRGRTELWRSDGTGEGTGRVAALPVPQGSTSEAVVMNGGFVEDDLVFSFTSDDSGGANLWRSDGTEVGTVPVAAVSPFIEMGDFTPVGNRMFFVSPTAFGDFFFPASLWVTDGTPEGTVQLLDRDVVHGSLVAVGDLLYFCNQSAGVTRMWRSDGTTDGTKPAFDRALPCNGEVATSGERLFFAAPTLRYGAELWSALVGGP